MRCHFAGWLCLSLLLWSTTLAAQQPPADKEERYDPFKNVVPVSKQIEEMESRVKKAPKAYANQVALAYLYIRDAREQADFSGYTKAEKALEMALKQKPNYPPALYVKAVIHSAHHRFRESLALARDLYKKNPRSYQLLMVIGDSQMELGDYAEAEKTYQQLAKKSPRTYLDSRMARLAFVKGKPKEAVEWMEKTLEGELFTAITKESRAWYLMRAGEMCLEVGDLKKGEAYLKEAFELHPKYPPTLHSLAKVKTAQGKYQQAIELYRRGIELNSDLGMLNDLGDLYLKLGNREMAQQCHSRFLKEAKSDPANAHELAEHYLNHDYNLAEALELAEKELKQRKTVHAYDAYAWALYKNKKYEQAAAAMQKARQWGTQEADLLYHAGMIHLKLSHRKQAKELLQQALKLNPHFSLIQGPRAQKALQELEKE